MHKAYDVYEKDSMFWFNGKDGNSFGPYSERDKAEWDSTEAEACEY